MVSPLHWDAAIFIAAEVRTRPVGVFDSGLGGLSVLREIRRHLPAESLVYVADSGFCPYGGRAEEEIRMRAHHVAKRLLDLGAKALVVACNTATIAAVESLRAAHVVPIVGMEPAVKPAAAHTRTGVVGVLATGAALAGEKFLNLVERHAGGVRVITRPCPGLVERVEAGDLDSPELMGELRGHVDPLLREGADVLVLGCTHYPFLAHAIRQVAGPGVALLDTGEAVARQLARRLDEAGLQASRDGGASPALRLRTTGSLDHLRDIAPGLWAGCAGADFDLLPADRPARGTGLDEPRQAG